MQSTGYINGVQCTILLINSNNLGISSLVFLIFNYQKVYSLEFLEDLQNFYIIIYYSSSGCYLIKQKT